MTTTPPAPTVLDLSHHNTVASWSSIKASGIQGVILKATDGPRYVDPTYAERRAAARAVGLLTGAYCFLRPGRIAAQVDLFVRTALPDDATLLALDWENNPDGPDPTVAEARQFLSLLMSATGRRPDGLWIYGGNVLKEQIVTLDDCRFFSQFRLWLCHYAARPTLPKAWTEYGLWQFSEKGAVDGMHADGHVDLNCHAAGCELADIWAPGAAAAFGPQVVPVAPPTATSRRADPDPIPVVMAQPETPAPAPAAPAQSSTAGGALGLLSQANFAKLNDLADQGSRVASAIRKWKALFWKMVATLFGGSMAASQFVDTSKGTGNAVSQLAGQHPFLLVIATVLVTLVAGYIGLKAIERGLISASNDGRYGPRPPNGNGGA